MYKGCVETGERVVAMNPELIIVHSPHGTLLSSSVALYGNSLAAGSAEWEGHWKEFDVSHICYYNSERKKYLSL